MGFFYNRNNMFRLLPLSIIQALCISTAQISLKIAMMRIDKFSWSWKFFGNLFTNWPLLLSGITALSGTFLWMYILKHYEFNIAYPLSAMTYMFGMIAAALVLHESVPFIRWIGLVLIIAGVILVQQQ
ncbi:MAG: EamA family transporter [Bacteroidales bacterium]|jgi:undecaprenyl phosphate-alpha-L-ara4N flippase subunit ArnE|nr:EamA family transporter [Bacteroidales bacterium]MBR5650764.1 EamA family transporter [Bacteroidales bacterium]MBR5719488.1 EamA family transporter [Bacteroidales bacterium]